MRDDLRAIQPDPPEATHMALRRSRSSYGGWLKTPVNEANAGCPRLLPVNVDVYPDRIVVQAQLPGFNAEEVEVRATERTVSIVTSREAGHSTAEQRVTGEVYQGNWYRRIRLPHPVRPDLASVTFQNGEITVELPRVPPERIPLNELPGAQSLEHPEIPLRSSADVMPPGPGPHINVFKP
jgi:HSP20 family protein